MRPKVKGSAVETRSMAKIDRRFVQALGFSNGCAALAFMKPPPFVPSCLIASWLAIGPMAMVCLAPSSVVASIEPSRVCGEPNTAKPSATMIESGSRT